MSEIPPSIPFHVGRAYGVSSPTLQRGQLTVMPARGETPQLRQAAPRLPSETVARLVAARVSGGIDFSTATPTPSAPSAALAFYRHPADKNAAATALTAGRVLDAMA